MMFTRRESIAFSSGRITWLLTCVVQSVTLINMLQDRQSSAQDEWAER
jgi:hypothetical protein